MSKEIERKFLVDESKIPEGEWFSVKQGYLNFIPQVRVRVSPNKSDITIKSDGMLTRDEWVYQIPRKDAEEMLNLCEHIIEKERQIIMLEGREWTIDRFFGDNKGLIISEVELKKEDEKVNLPVWVAKEVTGDSKYMNINLVRNTIK